MCISMTWRFEKPVRRASRRRWGWRLHLRAQWWRRRRRRRRMQLQQLQRQSTRARSISRINVSKLCTRVDLRKIQKLSGCIISLAKMPLTVLSWSANAACSSELRNVCAVDNIQFGGQAAGSFDLRNFRQNPCGNSSSPLSRVVARAVGVVVVVAMVIISVVAVSSQS